MSKKINTLLEKIYEEFECLDILYYMSRLDLKSKKVGIKTVNIKDLTKLEVFGKIKDSFLAEGFVQFTIGSGEHYYKKDFDELCEVDKKTIVLISGKKRAGKDSFYSELAEFDKDDLIKSTKVYFAEKLKAMAYEDTKILIERINDLIIDIAPKNIVTKLLFNKLYNKLYNELFTTEKHFGDGDKTLISRTILEFYGTNIFRNRFSDTYWTDLAIDVMREELKSNDTIYVTDTRFENEIDTVKQAFPDANVLVVRINRPELVDNNNHISNTALDKYDKFDEIYNENDLEELDLRAEDFHKKYLS